MLAVAMGGVIVTMVLALIRACRGPTVYDRALAVNSFSTVTILLIALDGFYQERPEFLDLAIVYAMIGFLGTLAVLRFVKYGNLARDEQTEP
jgi:multicomponent Na+:H+ antiporter subunit F